MYCFYFQWNMVLHLSNLSTYFCLTRAANKVKCWLLFELFQTLLSWLQKNVSLFQTDFWFFSRGLSDFNTRTMNYCWKTTGVKWLLLCFGHIWTEKDKVKLYCKKGYRLFLSYKPYGSCWTKAVYRQYAHLYTCTKQLIIIAVIIGGSSFTIHPRR